jgi:hypothetical protein
MYVTGGMNVARACTGVTTLLMREVGSLRIAPASASATGAMARMLDMENCTNQNVVNVTNPSTTWGDGTGRVRPAM